MWILVLSYWFAASLGDPPKFGFEVVGQHTTAAACAAQLAEVAPAAAKAPKEVQSFGLKCLELKTDRKPDVVQQMGNIPIPTT